MPLAAGARLGPYEVLEPLGSGGMGEVYKARDPRLNRTIAIKVLTERWTDDPAMQQRFEREAKAIAALNHPHVCTLHDVGRETPDGESAIDFLVMEYLEGQTLAERLQQGEVPLAETLKIAVAIADALDKAHKQGVVHRDLKPSNVMLTRRGPKILDFGLAKSSGVLAAVAGLGEGASMLPTAATAASVTTPGTILGTVQYMAPEQLEGKDADARTDIFAFGVILYEMLTGRKAFQGKSKTLLMSAILTTEPKPLANAQPMTPASIDHLVRRCLAKDPEERWQTAHDLLIQLRWIAGRGGRAAGAGPLTMRERVLRAVRIAAVILAGALAFPAAMYLWRTQPEHLQFRSPVVGISAQDIALSPDGLTIAFVAAAPEPPALYVRPVRSITSRRIAGTDGASQPFWSADSRAIGFVAGGKLKRVDIDGGAPKDVTAAPDFSGGAWGNQGTIVYGTAKGLMRVSAEGGMSEPATTVEKGETGHLWPAFLPDGRRFVYTAWTAQPGGRAVFSGALGSKERAQVMGAESNAVYAAPGYLVFHREASVFAQPFEAGAGTTSGQAIHLADGVLFDPISGRGAFDVSQTGSLIYFHGTGGQGLGRGRGGTIINGQLGWLDRRGELLTVASDVGTYGDFDLSPNGRLIAITRQDAGDPGADIWVIDWERGGVATPITRDPADDVDPVWSHDSKRVAYTSFRKGNGDIYVRNGNASGPETPLIESPAEERVEGWSSDGRYLLYVSGITTESDDIYALPLKPDGTPDGKPLLVVTGPGEKAEPQLSYDGKWLAYVSTESGSAQVRVTSFPDGLERTPISKDGGGQPRWRRDGRELYYRATDNAVMVVRIGSGPTLAPGVPERLFAPLFNAPVSRDPFRHQLAVNADGTRFLARIIPQAIPGTGDAGSLPGYAVFLSGQQPGGTLIPTSLLTAGRRGGGQRSRGAGPLFASTNGLTVVLNWQGK
jgi:Tol biopolymer transport system component/tRNA A-37 threonylcarbamoyl transferase component Bud32